MALHIDVTMDGLRQVRQRIDQRRLDDGDWPLFGAFVSNKIAREEDKRDRLLAKIAAARAASEAAAAEAARTRAEVSAGSDGDVIDVNFTVIDPDAEAKGDDPPSQPTGGAKPTAPAGAGANGKGGKNTGKGHGRNGAAAYTNAKDFFYTLAAGIIGSICAACKSDRMTSHRQQVTIRIVGQPMFGAERHHAEQARCKTCGRVVCALPTSVLDGIGKAVTYHWSACAMLIVLHYLYGLPFKRIESLHKAWGIPFADANQWQVSHEAMTLLAPLYKSTRRLSNSEHPDAYSRFSPTPVGNTQRRAFIRLSCAVQPHTRGAHSQRGPHNFLGGGSAPHPWGTPEARMAFGHGHTVQPHTRGEHWGEQCTYCRHSGSAPHPLGTPPRYHSGESSGRFSPTPVGNTSPRPHSPFRAL